MTFKSKYGHALLQTDAEKKKQDQTMCWCTRDIGNLRKPKKQHISNNKRTTKPCNLSFVGQCDM